jgi:hypothetical protein
MPVTFPFVSVAQGRYGTSNFLIPGFVPNNSSTLALTANQVRYFPIIVSTAITLDRLACEVTATGAGGTTIRLGIYNADTDWAVTSLVVDGGTVAADSTGVKTVTINTTLAPGRYLLACNSDGTPTLRSIRGALPGMGFVAALGATANITRMTASQTYDAFPSTGTAHTIGSGNQQYDYAVFCRVSVP